MVSESNALQSVMEPVFVHAVALWLAIAKLALLDADVVVVALVVSVVPEL